MKNKEYLETFAHSFSTDFYYNLVYGGYLHPNMIPDDYPELKQKVIEMNELGLKLEKIRQNVEELLENEGIETE